MQKFPSWTSHVRPLAQIAQSQPHVHVAYAAFTHVCKTIPNVSHLLEPLKEAITTQLFTVLTKRPPPNGKERRLFAMSTRLGGLGIVSPTTLSGEYEQSLEISASLVSQILQQFFEYPPEAMLEQQKQKI